MSAAGTMQVSYISLSATVTAVILNLSSSHNQKADPQNYVPLNDLEGKKYTSEF